MIDHRPESHIKMRAGPGPGPQDYKVKEVQKDNPKYSMSRQIKENSFINKDAIKNPGVGNYNINSRSVIKSSPGYSFQRESLPKLKSVRQPGPGQYETIQDKSKIKPMT